MGPEPLNVIKQLKNLIRNPSLPPYWALGFHMCRTTCNTNDGTRVVRQMRNYSVPFESDCGSSALSAVSFRDNFNDLKGFYNKIKSFNNITTKIIVTHMPQIKRDSNLDGKLGENLAYKSWSQLALETPDGKIYNGSFWDWCKSSSGIQKIYVR
jgi:alpha-glucosidase (family GH31 glycosyl hydrolase)